MNIYAHRNLEVITVLLLLLLLLLLLFQNLRQRNDELDCAHRACQASLEECQQKLDNFRIVVEKRADDEDEMEKLVVSLNNKVTALEVRIAMPKMVLVRIWN